MAEGGHRGFERQTSQARTLIKYTPDIVLKSSNLGAHWVRHIRGNQPKETTMTTPTLRIVAIGSARALTQAELDGLFAEIGVYVSRTPM